MAGGVFSSAKLNGITLRESADDGSDFTNPDADYRRLFLGEDGQLHVKDSAGTVTTLGGAVADILDLPTAETDDTLVLAPDGAGGVEFRAESGGHGAWTNYTPTLTASSSNPTLGSSTVTGRYKQLDSKTYIIQARLDVVTGGAWNAGSGEYRFSLPAGLTLAGMFGHGACSIFDSGTARYAGIVIAANGSTFIGPMAVGDGTGDRTVRHNAPITWATGDWIACQITVEVA